jgi:hypothetical protein
MHKIYNASVSDQRTLPILLSLPQTCFPVSFKNTDMSTKQDKQCTQNATLRHIHATTVAMEEQYYIFCECICSLR